MIACVRSLVRAVTLAVALVLAVAPAAWSASPQITFYFGLSRPEAAARAAYFTVQRPGSSTYRRFLSPRGVAARYGASTAVRGRFLHVIRGYGFSARVDPSGVFARVSGSVARFQRVFHVSIRHFSGDEPPVNAYAAKRALRLPAALAPLVQDVVTSFARQIRVSAGSAGAARAVVGQAAGRGPRRTGTWAQGCAKAKATGAFSYAQVRHAYGVDRLGAGAGASVAILGLQEAPSARDIADNARCFGYRRLRSRTILTDGQIFPISPGNDFEPQLDSAAARGMAPSTSLMFTQAVSGADQWFLGASQILDAPTLPDSFSISYGICESDPVNGPYANPSNRSGADLLDSLLVRLGLAGVGSYASAGDGGSSCNGALGPSGRPLRGVTWPGSSPYLTSVGGTRLTLTSANQRRNEVVWNDLQWRSRANGGGAGGGGLSLFAPRPPFQAGLGLPGHYRAVPDMAAAASNFPGWPIVDGGTWLVDGGTSAAAPLVASAMAVISADLRSRHLPPIGPADGLLYFLGRHQPSAIWDVIHGSNGFLASIPARHAKRGYDLASGLGVPQFARIARGLPSPAPISRRTSGLG
jgi:subtilase family serine protease